MADKTNFAQSLMHMIKGNLGTGILAMPASFKHCGLVSASIGLPLLCFVATYCVHLLIRSSQHLESKMDWMKLEYAGLAKGAFKSGPSWMRPWSALMCRLVDGVLIVSQIGICCVYLVFIIANLETISLAFNVQLSRHFLYVALFPIVLAISCVRTLKRLAIASACANVLQVLGISVIVEYLIRTMGENPHELDHFNSVDEVALGFGSAMFAFEGISVALPIYTRMKRPDQMGGFVGVINISYALLMILYFIIGLFGYLRFGHEVKDSITLNLPAQPIYEIVRAMFAMSVLLTYPLQFYVPNEIIWNGIKDRLEDSSSSGLSETTTMKKKIKEKESGQDGQASSYEYLCRTFLVTITFLLAYYIPKLNLMMDLVGSISGTALSIILPAVIHLAAFWEDTSGVSKAFMLTVDTALIIIGLIASASGSYVSFNTIVRELTAETI